MKCRGCGYVLWGLKARMCPECGLAFKLSERVFVSGKVVFGCPACGTEYLGKSEDGLPEPSEFACRGCSMPLRVDDLVARTAPGVRGRVEVLPTPWCERKRIGRWRAWFRTVRRVWNEPSLLIRGVVKGRSAWEALWFGAMTWALAATAGLWGVALVIVMGVGAAAWATSTIADVWFAPIAIGVGLLAVVGGVGLLLGSLTLSGLVAHLVLIATGKTKHGLRGTFEAIGYSSATAVLSAVPCLSVYLTAPAVVVQSVYFGVMLSARQGVAWWRSLIAVAPVGVIFVLLLGVWSIPFMTGITGFAAAQQFSHSAAAQFSFEVDVAHANRHLSWHERTQGAPAKHGMDLIQFGLARPEDFVGAQLRQAGQYAPSLIPATAHALQARWEAQRLAMPAGVVAHRVGQIVFTHHGMNSSSASPDLWRVIGAPMPVAEDLLGAMPNPGSGVFDGSIVVIDAAGHPRTIAAGDVPKELAAQNALRAQHGLPPLPDPFTVLEGQPAVAGGSGP